jgi:hypothetical protein
VPWRMLPSLTRWATEAGRLAGMTWAPSESIEPYLLASIFIIVKRLNTCSRGRTPAGNVPSQMAATAPRGRRPSASMRLPGPSRRFPKRAVAVREGVGEEWRVQGFEVWGRSSEPTKMGGDGLRGAVEVEGAAVRTVWWFLGWGAGMAVGWL